MQIADSQHKTPHTDASADRVGVSSIPLGCISKKWICFTLRPYLKGYRPQVVRLFFTAERLERCGITPDEYPRIRVFSPEATSIIVSDLKKYGFIK